MSTSSTANDRHNLGFPSRKKAPSQSTMSFSQKLFGNKRSKDESSQKLKKGVDPVSSKDWSKEPIGVVVKLDKDVLNRLPLEVLEKLPPEGLKRLDQEVLVTLSPDALSRLPTEHMRSLPPEIIGALPPKTLARLVKPSPGILSKLNAEVLGRLLPELTIDDLNTMPRDALSNIADVDPGYLVRIPEQGLILLVHRNPELYISLQSLEHDQFLRLPRSILERMPFERFQKIPGEVWAEQPEQVLLNLPLGIKKALPKREDWPRPNPRSEMPPTVSSVENEPRASSPTTPPLPVDTPQDGIHTPKAASSMNPPTIPPRATKPPLSYNNQANSHSPMKRSGSFSAPRSQSSQDFRTPGLRYPEAPDWRGSKSTNDGGDIRGDQAYRLTPPLPDPRFRSEVPDSRREMEELKHELMEKEKRIAELEDERKRAEARFKEKEVWLKELIEDESKKLVNLTAGTISSRERVIKALAAMAPDMTWDHSHPDPVAELIKFSGDLNAWKQWHSSRIFDFLETAVPTVAWDRSNPDPTELIINLARSLDEWKIWSSNRIFNSLDQLLPDKSFDRTLDPIEAVITHLGEVRQSAQKNFDTATYYQKEYSREQEENTRLENQLELALKEARKAKEEQSTAEWSLKEKVGLLSATDSRVRNLGMQIAQLEHERDGHAKKARELEKQIMTERAAAQTDLIKQQTHYETQTQGIKQLNMTLQTQLAQQKEKWAQEVQKHLRDYERSRKGLEEALQQAERKCLEDLKAQEAHFTQELQRTSTYYDDELRRAHQAHQQELKNHSVNLQKKIESLESDLVDNSDDFRPATDDSLKTRYGSLKLLVETITEPFNLGTVTVPQDGRFDPDNFLVREGKAQTRVLLRSKVWASLMDGFFSSPFGFGCFGSAQGKLLLLELYSAWRKLFGDGPLPVSGFHVPDEIFDRFRTEKEANKWRSATFQSIFMAVSPRGQKKNQAANGHLVKPFVDNRQKVHDDILDVINQVCTDGVSQEIADNIVKIVQLAGELALEFGSQRAELALDTPGKGESITIGPEFVDCEDGESERGSKKEVELLVLPKLFRVGDGRNDLKTRKIIVPGEIYPRRS